MNLMADHYWSRGGFILRLVMKQVNISEYFYVTISLAYAQLIHIPKHYQSIAPKYYMEPNY